MSAGRRKRSNNTSTRSQGKRGRKSTINNRANVSYNDDVDYTISTTNLPIAEESPQSSEDSTSAQISTHSPESHPGSSVALESSDKTDYLTQFTTINSVEQRLDYESVYNSYYEEYLNLHIKMDIASEYFLQLQEELDRQTRLGNSRKCQRLQMRIVRSANIFRKIPNFTEQRERFDYLYNKLAHIERLLREFDERYNTTTATTSGAEGSSNVSKDIDSATDTN